MKTLRLQTWSGLIFLATMFLSPIPAHSAPRTTVNEVAKELVCDCPDCGKQTVNNCAPGCEKGIKYRAEIAADIARGQSKQQILNAFADKYGEQMLGNPRPRGFSRLAPLMPFACLFFGAFPLLLTLRARRARSVSSSQINSTPEPIAADDARLTAALRDYDF